MKYTRDKFEIVKPEFFSDIYTAIKNIGEIEEEFSLEEVFCRSIEDKKQILFCDIKKGWVFDYCTSNTYVQRYVFDSTIDLLDYLKALLVEFKDDENIYLYNLKELIKKAKLFIESKKPSNIQELKKGEHVLKVGMVLYTSWGYDQTNVEMFRVVKLLGKNYFIIQEIGQSRVENSEGFMCCSVTEGSMDLDKLPIKAFISNDGYMSVCESGYKRALFVHEKGEKHYKSWYA